MSFDPTIQPGHTFAFKSEFGDNRGVLQRLKKRFEAVPFQLILQC